MITTKMIEEKVRELAKQHPDFVYQGTEDDAECYYLRGGDPDNPGCIIGRAVLALDSDLRPLLAIADSVNNNVSGLLNQLCLPESDWLEEVQVKQDLSYTWKQAIEYADSVCE